MTAILLALTASFAWGFSDYAGGVASRTLRVPVVVALSMIAGSVVVVPAALLEGAPAFQGAEAAWAVAAGALAMGSLGLMFAAMAVGAVSIAGPVSACGVVIPVLAGLLRGEQPHGLQLAGIAVAALGVVLASIERGSGRGGARLVAGLGLALASAVCVGLWFLTLDLASTHDPIWATLVARPVTITLAMLGATLWRRPARATEGAPAAAGHPARAADGGPQRSSLRRAGRPVLMLVVAAGLADAVGELTFAVSTTHGFISVVSVVASLYPAFMVALAALFLRERLARHQAAGVAAALLGIALISAG